MSTAATIPVWLTTGDGRRVLEQLPAAVAGNALVASDTTAAAGGALEVRSEAAALAANALVYISGWNETYGLPLVTKADADASGRQAQFVCRSAIPINTNGVVFQTARSAATLDTQTGTSAVGDPVYLDTTAGGWTATAPTASNAVVQIVGRVAVRSATVGVLEFDLRDLPTVGSNDVQDGAVTLAKMANIATDRLIGRDTAATGVPEALTVGGGVEFTGSGGIQTSAFTGDVTKAAGGTATTIAANAVTSAQLAAAMRTWLNAIRTWLADGMLQIGTLVISGADAIKYKTTTTLIYTIAGLPYTKAATDNLTFSAAYTVNTGKAAGTLWGVFLVQINAAGTVSTKAPAADQVYTSEALAIAALPAVDASNVQVGYITVGANDTDDWIANTDDLTEASDCLHAHFYDLPAAKSLPAAL